MAEQTIKRKSKDSVFVKLFQDKRYVLQLYKELHPEDTDVSVEDIDITTLESFILNTQYNDLGFTVKDKLVFLFEAQSTWNLNILVRMLIYIVETYRKYLDTTNQSVHQSSKVKLPLPELYVFYSGKTERPEMISLNDEFFEGKADIDLKIRIFNQVDPTLAGQYIGFCRVFDDQRKNCSDAVEAAKATFRICIENGYLTEFMKAHEMEVVDMMSELFDVEHMTRQYERAVQREKEEYAAEAEAKGIAKGIAKGRAEGIAKGRADTLKEAISKMVASGMSEEQAKGILGV